MSIQRVQYVINEYLYLEDNWTRLLNTVILFNLKLVQIRVRQRPSVYGTLDVLMTVFLECDNVFQRPRSPFV